MLNLQAFRTWWTNYPLRLVSFLGKNRQFMVTEPFSLGISMANSGTVARDLAAVLKVEKKDPRPNGGSSGYSTHEGETVAQGLVASPELGGNDLNSDNPSNKYNEYGEERVILVRDEQTRRDLQKKVGEFALVTTILQSKGMEFEDVFLYDFFSTSPYSRNFEILQNLFIEKHGIGEPSQSGVFAINFA
jgi:hypothetical protein